MLADTPDPCAFADGSAAPNPRTPSRPEPLCEERRLREENRTLREENQTLREQSAALSRSNADLEQFAWAASHDLKEPLRTIATYTQTLLRRRPPTPGSEEAECAAFVHSALERLNTMIDGLLAYARSGRGEAQFQIADAAAIAADAIESLHGMMAECAATVLLAPLPPVAAAPMPVLQVFSNLIANALKYRPAGSPPRIEIFADTEEPPVSATGTRSASMIRFAVRDNGTGIDPEYLERIFEPFQRLHGDEYPGVGLGLALSKRLVERLGGRIWVESQPGSGSTFYFTLPAAPSGAAAVSAI